MLMRWVCAIGAGAVLACGGAQAARAGTATLAGASFELKVLGPLGVIGQDSFSLAVNDRGQVAGYLDAGDGRPLGRAVRYARGTLQTLPALPGGQWSAGRGINNAGVTVGTSQFSDEGALGTRGFLYQHGRLLALPTLGGQHGTAQAVNDLGHATGYASTGDGRLRAVLYQDGRALDLGTLGGPSARGQAINNRGQVAGTSFTGKGRFTEHAFLWTEGRMVDLGALDARSSAARALNDAGEVAGYLSYGRREDRAFVYRDGTMLDLGTFGGRSSRAYGLNDAGDVVGWAEAADGRSRAFLYRDGRMIDLNNVVDAAGWRLEGALDIANTGYITGWGTYQGQTTAFLLRPTAVPEPSGLALAGAGLAGLLAWTRRRKARAKAAP